MARHIASDVRPKPAPTMCRARPALSQVACGRGYESVFSHTLGETFFQLWRGGGINNNDVMTVTNRQGTAYYRLVELGLRQGITDENAAPRGTEKHDD